MIPEINRHSNLYGSLKYNMDKVTEGSAKILMTNRIYSSPYRDPEIGEMFRDIMIYQNRNKNRKDPVLHISINPAKNDIITEGTMKEVVQEYLNRMGWGDQPFVIFKHEDIDRHHIHIVTTNIDKNGIWIDDSNDRRRSVKIARDIEKKYGLQPGDVKNNKQTYRAIPINYQDSDLKHQIKDVLQALKNYGYQTMGEYKALLLFFNIEAEHISGNYKGKPFVGIIYTALDENGERVGKPIKASLYGKTFGYNAVLKHLETSKLSWKKNKPGEHCLKVIEQALSISKSRNEFISLLDRQNIDVLFRENMDGRIYGVTFIDHKSKFAFNGSRLGRNYSANFFESKFCKNKLPEEKQEKGIPDSYSSPSQDKASVSPKRIDRIITPKEEESMHNNYNDSFHSYKTDCKNEEWEYTEEPLSWAEVLEGISGVFIPNEYEEDEATHKLQAEARKIYGKRKKRVLRRKLK